MFCRQCGSQIDDNADFCRFCGADMRPVKAAMQQAAPAPQPQQPVQPPQRPDGESNDDIFSIDDIMKMEPDDAPAANPAINPIQ